MAGGNVAYNAISNAYEAPDESSGSEYTTDSEGEGEPAPSDPATDWFNSISLLQPTQPPGDAIKPKRGFISEEVEPPKKKAKVVESKLAVSHSRSGEYAIVKVLVPPGVIVLTFSLVQRGLGKHTEHIVVPEHPFHTATVPLGAARDHRDLSISPPSKVIEESLKVSNQYIFV